MARVWVAVLLIVGLGAAVALLARLRADDLSVGATGPGHEVDHVEGGDLAAARPGSDARPVPVLRGAGGAEARTDADAAERIMGIVVDTDGGPIAGASVCATPDEHPRRAPTCTTSDASGRFELRTPDPGLHRVAARVEVPTALEATALLATGDESHRLVLTPAPPRMAVEVVDPAGARVSRFRVSLHLFRGDGVDGHALLPVPRARETSAARPYELKVWNPADAEGRGLDLGGWVQEVVPEAGLVVRVVLPSVKAVHVHVVDEAGVGLADVSVLLRAVTPRSDAPEGSPDPLDNWLLRTSSVRTDAHGHARLPRLLAGVDHRVRVEDTSDRRAAELPIVGPNEQGARVRLLRGGDVLVRVVDEHGAVPGASVKVFREPDRPRNPMVSATTSADGSVRLANLVASLRHYIVVDGPGVTDRPSDPTPPKRHARLQVPDWRPAATTWRLEYARPLRVRVEDERGEVWPKVTATVSLGERLLAEGAVGNEGVFVLADPPAGVLRVRVEVTHKGKAFDVVERDVAEHERADVRFVVPAGDACEVDVRASEPFPLGAGEELDAFVSTRPGSPGRWELDRVRSLAVEPSSVRCRVTARRWPEQAIFACWVPEVGYAVVPIAPGGRVDAQLQRGGALTLTFEAGLVAEGRRELLILDPPVDSPLGALWVRAIAEKGAIVVRGLPPGTWNVRMPGLYDRLGRRITISAHTGGVTHVPVPDDLRKLNGR